MRIFVLAGFMAVAACGPFTPLPPHTFTSDPLYAGSNRVQVDVSSDISAEECEALLENYSSMAGSEGQVSVHKPSAKLEGTSAPWCVDNRDGEGVRWNDTLF